MKPFLSIVLLLILLSISIAPRLYRLPDSEIYPDEVTWTVRSKEVFNHLRGGNFSYFFKDAWWDKKNDTEAIALPLTFLGGLGLRLFGQVVSDHSFKILSDIDSVRLPVAVLSALFSLVFFYYLQKIIDSKIAFIVALFLALDPMMLALSRWALNDALLTIFSTLSLISYIANIKEKKITPFPGIFLALAFLTKPIGILPIIGWIIATLLTPQYRKRVQGLIINLLVAIVLIYLCWPAMYTNPFYIVDYLVRQFQLTQINMAQADNHFETYFLGKVTNNPPFYYYLFLMAIRIPSLVIIGLLISIFLMSVKTIRLRSTKKILFEYSTWIPIIIYTIIFYLAIEIPSKKSGIRYALPLFPWIYLASIYAWYKLFKPFNKILIAFTMIGLFSYLYTIVEYTPQFYWYYNNLIGGPKNAQNYELPNLCLGAKGASKFINNYPDTMKVTYLGCNGSIFSYYTRKQFTTNWKEPSDLVVLEDDSQRLSPNQDFVRYLNSRQPLVIISEKGIDVAKIYLNQRP